MFSSRLPDDIDETPLARRLKALRHDGHPVLDLTLSNPTRAGFDYPVTEIREAFARGAELPYVPDPRGLPAAREAIAEYYAGEAACHAEADPPTGGEVETRAVPAVAPQSGAKAGGSGGGTRIDPDAIVCTSASSEAYSMLFKLLCEPGDEVCIPHPAYPLFSWLAALDAVRVRPYNLRLAPDGRWHIDMTSLDMAMTERTRAVIVVNPSNPAANYLRPEEFARLDALCARRGIALVTDEVFWDYPLDADIDGNGLRQRTVGIPGEALRFTINGLSKLLALPQMKLGWVIVEGPLRLRDEALARLDIIADAYLSVSTPVMAAAPTLLGLRHALQQQIGVRCLTNLALARRMLPHSGEAGDTHPDSAVAGATLLLPEGGWGAMLALDRGSEEEAVALRLLEEQGVLVHPGVLFDIPIGAHLVISLLADEADFAEAMQRLRRCLG